MRAACTGTAPGRLQHDALGRGRRVPIIPAAAVLVVALADGVLADLVGEQREDDVALLGVRLSGSG